MSSQLPPVEDRWIDQSLARPRYEQALPAAREEARLSSSYRWGAAVGLALFLVVLTGGRPTLTSWAPAGGFYDAQARSLLDGHLDVDPARLGIEGFESGGKTYMYQPPFPAILRTPVVAVTDSYEGRLGQISVLLALIVALSATRRILVHARRAVRADAGVTRLERALGFGLGACRGRWFDPRLPRQPGLGVPRVCDVGDGLDPRRVRRAAPPPLRAHLGSPRAGRCSHRRRGRFPCIGRRRRLRRHRPGCVGSVLMRRGRARPRPTRRPGGAVALLLAAFLPAMAYAALNVAKFDSVASIPFEQQTFTRLSPARQAMLDENDGTLFGLQFAPTTIVHYLRLDGVRLTTVFPFVDFPPPGEPIVGDVAFDLVDRSSSVPASLFGLLIPGLIGLWTIGRRRLHDPPGWLAVTGGGLGRLRRPSSPSATWPTGTWPTRCRCSSCWPRWESRSRAPRPPTGSPRLARRVTAAAWAGLAVLVPCLDVDQRSDWRPCTSGSTSLHPIPNSSPA